MGEDSQSSVADKDWLRAEVTEPRARVTHIGSPEHVAVTLAATGRAGLCNALE
jgi:hypothetical protein